LIDAGAVIEPDWNKWIDELRATDLTDERTD